MFVEVVEHLAFLFQESNEKIMF